MWYPRKKKVLRQLHVASQLGDSASCGFLPPVGGDFESEMLGKTSISTAITATPLTTTSSFESKGSKGFKESGQLGHGKKVSPHAATDGFQLSPLQGRSSGPDAKALEEMTIKLRHAQEALQLEQKKTQELKEELSQQQEMHKVKLQQLQQEPQQQQLQEPTQQEHQQPQQPSQQPPQPAQQPRQGSPPQQQKQQLQQPKQQSQNPQSPAKSPKPQADSGAPKTLKAANEKQTEERAESPQGMKKPKPQGEEKNRQEEERAQSPQRAGSPPQAMKRTKTQNKDEDKAKAETEKKLKDQAQRIQELETALHEEKDASAKRIQELETALKEEKDASAVENGKHEVERGLELEPILQEATKTKQALEVAERKNNQLEEAHAKVRKELEEERSKIHESTLQVEYWKRRYESSDSGLHKEQNQEQNQEPTQSSIDPVLLQLEQIHHHLSTVESHVFRMPLDARLELIDKEEGVGNLSIVESEDILRELHAVAPKILPKSEWKRLKALGKEVWNELEEAEEEYVEAECIK